jgi:hypothetical protein
VTERLIRRRLSILVAGALLTLVGLVWNASASTGLSSAEQRLLDASDSTFSQVLGGFGDGGSESDAANAAVDSKKRQQIMSALVIVVGLGLITSGVVVRRRPGKASKESMEWNPSVRLSVPFEASAGVASSADQPLDPSAVSPERRPCADCGGFIPVEARICRFCRADLSTTP